MPKQSECTERQIALRQMQALAEQARERGNVKLSDAYARIIIQAQRVEVSGS